MVALKRELHCRSHTTIRYISTTILRFADVYSTSTFHPRQTGMASTSGQCVTSVRFLCNLQLYLGKEGESPEQQQAARVVSDLATLVYGSARNITTDNFFTSHALAKFLLGQN